MYKKFAWGCETDKDGDGEGVVEKNPLRYQEHVDRDLYYSAPVTAVKFSGKTKFQDVKILETIHFGKCLIMDNHMQSAESDETIYHESLVHPAMLSHPHPRRVFIGGGGEGATLREVLKHSSVDEVVMVDLDEQTVKLCEEMMPEWNAGGFKDKRAKLHFEDADAFLKKCSPAEKFDVIIMDICDPLDGGPAWKLYSTEFYQRVKEHNLQPNGVLCTQSTACNRNLLTECFTIINKTLRSAFKYVEPYRVDVPSFGCPWAFHICADQPILNGNTDADHIDKALSQRLSNSEAHDSINSLTHYDGGCHRHMFNLSKYERLACAEEERLFTLEKPFFMQ